MFIGDTNVAAPFADLFGPARTRPEPPAPGDRLTVQRIDAALHAAFVGSHSASFLQTPAWAGVKPDWRNESLGWFEGEELVGAALVLYRPVPKTKRSLAYLPEGPTLPWDAVNADPGRWLDPMVEHLRTRGAFAVRMGPEPEVRIWNAATAKQGLVDPEVLRFSDLPPDEVVPEGQQLVSTLTARGWQPVDREEGFGGGQPRFGVWLRLAGRTPADLLADCNQQWRRNVAKSVKEGVVVREGSIEDLPTFHRLYAETGERDGFRPRPESYFTRMWRALDAGPEPRLRLYIGELGPDRIPLCAALVVQVGQVCWYSYGASSSQHRQAQASTAVQWHAICAAQARGAFSYNLRGVADTLDEKNSLTGLLRFKLGTGGSVVEAVGEWELTISPMWHEAFRLYLKVRS
jgi:lipid II:glycine glycyltransferase (peptidoglycan interpeptide bridge formation enzyme)